MNQPTVPNAVTPAPGPYRTFNAGMVCDANGVFLASCHNIHGMSRHNAFQIFANAALLSASWDLKETAKRNLALLLEIENAGKIDLALVRRQINDTQAAIRKTAGGV